MTNGIQQGFEDMDTEYREFVEKFKPKKTTDDCYTPENIYAAVRDYVIERYGIEERQIVRPFWPGADYRAMEYAPDAVIVDNPPFSILSAIVRDYNRMGLRYFLFAPYLTNFSVKNCQHIICDADVTYTNGAIINTCFVTNMEPEDVLARTAPELCEIIAAEDRKNREKQVRKNPRYKYPANLITPTMMGYLSVYGVDFVVKKSDGIMVGTLDAQRPYGKSIYGNGYLTTRAKGEEYAAARRQAEENKNARTGEELAYMEWKLSEREMQIVQRLEAGSHE